MGEKVTAVEYLKALELREKFIAGFHLALLETEVDVLVTPTTPIPAPLIGEEKVSIGGKEHSTRALLLRLNRPANLGGVPAISIPCGRTMQGLPVGLQFMAGVTDEPLLIEPAKRPAAPGRLGIASRRTSRFHPSSLRRCGASRAAPRNIPASR